MDIDEFELRVVEFQRGIYFALQDEETQLRIRELIAEQRGQSVEDVQINPEALVPGDLDMDLIHQICEYLIWTEELGADILPGAKEGDSIELYTALRVALFIYGWEAYKANE